MDSERAPVRKGVHLQFSEDDRLFHYTGTEGLYGILRSDTLWATHFQFLNDTQEFRSAQQSLGSFVQKHMLARLAAHKVNRSAIPNEGVVLRDLAKSEAEKLIEIIHKVVFKLVDPFVFSAFLCRKADERRFRDGDLQHWATYGHGSGFALQINPSLLAAIFEAETDEFTHAGLFGAPVEYASGDAVPENLEDEYRTLASVAVRIMDDLIAGRTTADEVVDESFLPFNKICAFIKDSYFSHEREGRIAFYRVKRVPAGRKNHAINILPKGAHGIPYIRLFEGKLLGSQPLIERIMLGPHPENGRRRLALEAYLLSRNLNIEVSESGERAAPISA